MKNKRSGWILLLIVAASVVCSSCGLTEGKRMLDKAAEEIQELADSLEELVMKWTDRGDQRTEGLGQVIAVEEDVEVSDFSQAKKAAVQLGLCGNAKEAESVLGERYQVQAGGVTCYRMDQIYEGIPVYRRGVSVVTDGDGKVDLVSSNYAEIQEAETEPQLDEEGLQDALKDYAAEKYPEWREEEISFTRDESSPLTIYCDESGQAHLAYVGQLMAEGWELEGCEILIDASDGKVLLSVPLYTEVEKADFRYTFSPEGHRLNFTYPVALEKAPEGKDYLIQDSEKGLYLYEGMGGKSLKDGGKLEVARCSEEEFVQVISENQKPEVSGALAYIMANVAYDFYDQVLEREGYDGINGTTRILYDSSMNGTLADRLNPWNVITFLEDGKKSAVICAGSWADLGDWNLIGHEYTHTVTLHFFGNYGNNALMEGYSDGMAEMMEAYFLEEDPDWVNTGVSFERKLRPEKGKGKEGSQIYQYQYYTDKTECHDGGTIVTYVMAQIWDSWRPEMGVKAAAEMLSMLMYRTLFILPDSLEYESFAKALDATAQAMAEQGKITVSQAEHVRTALVKANIPFESADSKEVQEAKDVISQYCVQVLDKETGEPVEGAEVQLIRTIWFLPLPFSWGKTDEYGRCVFDRFPGRDKVEVRVRAEGYEELLESATWMETYFPVEEQTGDIYEAVNVLFITPEDYEGEEITAPAESEKETESIPDKEEPADLEEALNRKLEELLAQYGRISTEEDYLASGEPGIITQVVSSERLTGILMDQIGDYDGDGAPELLVFRGDGGGYAEGATNHLTRVEFYLTVYEAEGQADEITLRMPGLPDSQCVASLQLFLGERQGKPVIYLDYLLNMNAQCYGIAGFKYENGSLSLVGGVENTEWPSFAGACVSDSLEEEAGLFTLCGRLCQDETADTSAGTANRPGWSTGKVYDWSRENRQDSKLDEYRNQWKGALEEMGLQVVWSRSYLDQARADEAWIEQSCRRRPKEGYACLEGEMEEGCGIFSSIMMGDGVALTCYSS